MTIRVPGVTAAALEASNRYLDAGESLSADLMALGLHVARPAELDALLDGFLTAYRPSGYLKVSAEEYSRLALAVDRLFIDSGIAAGGGIDLPAAP